MCVCVCKALWAKSCYGHCAIEELCIIIDAAVCRFCYCFVPSFCLGLLLRCWAFIVCVFASELKCFVPSFCSRLLLRWWALHSLQMCQLQNWTVLRFRILIVSMEYLLPLCVRHLMTASVIAPCYSASAGDFWPLVRIGYLLFCHWVVVGGGRVMLLLPLVLLLFLLFFVVVFGI